MLARNLRLALAVTTGLCSTAFFAAPVAAQNLPVGASVAGQSGSNAITYGTSGTTGTLNLGDNQRSIINWNSFDVSNGYTMQFQYSGADRGAVLNRVTGGAHSEIYGGLSGPSNLDVFLLNPNGILFGAGANVNVGGLVAGTLGLADADFMDGDGTYNVSGTGTTGVIVQPGAQIATGAGPLALFGGFVDSGGTLTSGGNVVLAAASDISVQLAAGSPLSMTINQGTPISGTVVNVGGTVSGANVYAATASRTGVVDALLNVSGAVTATSALATDRGIVLAAGATAQGVAVEAGAGNDTRGPGRIVVDGSLTSAAIIDMRATGTLTGSGVIHADDAIAANANGIAIGAVSAGSDINLNGGAGGIGHGAADLILTAGGNIVLGGAARARDIAITAGGALSTAALSARDDIVTRAGGATGVGTMTSGTTVDALGAVDIAGAADALAGAVLTGNDADVITGGNLNVTSVSGANDVRFQAGGTATVTGALGVGQDYSITAGNFAGNSLSPTFGGGGRDFAITDTSGGLSLGGALSAPRNLSVTVTNGGGLILTGGLTAGTGNVSLTTLGGGSVELDGGDITDTGSDDAVILNASGAITQDLGSVISTASLSASAESNIGLGSTNQIGAFTSLQSSSGRIVANSNMVGGVLFGDVDAGSGYILLQAGSGLRLVGGTSDIDAASGDVYLFGPTTVSGAVAINAAGTGQGTVTFNNALDGAAANTGNLTVTAAGGTTFAGAVGGTATLNTLTVNGATALNGGSVRTGGAQSFNGATNLGAATTLTSTGGGAVAFGGTVDGAQNLTVLTSGVTTFNGDVGGTTPLGILILDAPGSTVINADVTTFGYQQYNGATTLAGDLTGTSSGYTISFNGALTLSGAGVRKITTGSSAYFNTVDSAVAGLSGLSVSTVGGAYFSGAVGGTSALGGLAINSMEALFTGTNNVGTLAAVIGFSGLTFTNGSALTIGTVGGISGISTAGTVTISSASLALDEGVSAGSANVGLGAYVGAITGSGLIEGDTVSLSGTTGIGTSTDRVNTAANSLVAYSGAAGAVNINEADSVILGGGGGTGFDVVAGGNVTTTSNLYVTAGDLVVAANDGGSISLGGNLSAGGAGDIRLNAEGSLSSNPGVTLVAEDIVLTADDWTGGVLTSATLQETQDLSITDTAGGLTIGLATDLGAARNLSISTVGGDLTVGGIASGGDATLSSTGALTITAASNYIGGDFAATAVGPVMVNEHVHAIGNVLIRSSGGALSIGSLGALIGDDVTLAAATSFANASGSDAINASNRWLVYSAAPDANIYGGLDSGNTAIWNATYDSVDPSSISGNRYVFAYQPTLTFASADANKTYGTLLTTSGYTVSGLHAGVAGAFLGDTAATAFSGAPVLNSAGYAADATVAGGPYAIGIAAGTVSSGNGYALAFDARGSLTVTPKALNAVVTADDKTYDGTLAATGSVSLDGILFGDDVTTSALLAFADKNAGSNKTVTISGGSLSGADAGNYTLTLPASTLATIVQKAISGTVVANDKTYDGTTAATGSVGLTGVIDGDTVTASALLAFVDKNAGSNKTVTISGGSLSGADAGNYTLTLPASTLATIFQKAITGTVTANDKTYDGTMTATGSVNLSGVVNGDTVNASALLAFVDKNAGSNKTITISGGSLSGADAGNYTLTLPASTLATIFQKAISGTVAANDKTYDGTTAATGSVGLTGVIDGDTVTASALLAFVDKNAGVDKTVTISGGSLSGADAGNYSLTLPASTLATIFQKAISGTVAANDKTYDGASTATGSVGLTGVVDGDAVTGSANLAFADKNAGTDKTVLVSGGALSGADAGNYTLTLPATVVADILQKALGGTVTANDKTYDGTTAATGSVNLSGVVDGDAVTGSANLAFADKNAGTDKTVIVSGGALSGADAGNYTLTLSATVVADILQKALGGTVTANDKTYDGTTAATGSIALSGVVDGDSVTGNATYAFADANAGTDKTVNVSGGSLSGADAGNYSLALPATVIADILQRALTIAANDALKEAGQADPAFTYSLVDGSLVAGDSVSGALGRDPGEAAGQYAITQGTLAAGPNYSITFENGVLTIAPAPQAATSGPDLQPLRATPLPAHLRSLDRRGSPVTIAPGIFCDREKPCPVR